MIYGTNNGGTLCAQCFDRLGLVYEAFCVSHRRASQQEKLNHPIYEFCELKHDVNGLGIVMAMGEQSVGEVMADVQKVMERKHIFCDLKFNEDIYYEDVIQSNKPNTYKNKH